MANNKIQVKRTSTAGRTPNTTNAGNSQYIAAGELALNMTDKTFFTSDGTNLIYVGANTVDQNISNTLTVKAISANGSNGSAGQVLTTNSTGTYWSTVSSGSGTVTSVATGNGLTGGPITTTGTVSVQPNTGIVANATGVYVNATYIGTLSANNAAYLGGTAAAGYQTTAGLSSNVATLTSNNSTYFGGYTWAAPAILGGTTANGASLKYANVSGQVNTVTFYATTSANIASGMLANATGIYPTTNSIALGNSTSRWILNANTIDGTGDWTTTGNVGIGAVASSNAQLYLNKTWTSTDNILYGERLLYITSNVAATSAQNRYGLLSQVYNNSQHKNADGVTLYTGNHIGSYNQVTNGYDGTTFGGDARANGLYGTYSYVSNYANGAAANTIGNARVLYSLFQQFGSGVVTDAYGLDLRVMAGNNSVVGNITTVYGVSANIVSNTAMTIDTGYLYYGAHLGSTTTTKYGVYVTGEANNYFSGNVSVVGTVTAGLLSGNISGSYANITGQVNTVTLYATTSANVGANVQLTTSQLTIGSISASSNGSVLTNTSLTLGNSSVNSTMNATTFTGNAYFANNATNLGGTAAASYVQNTDSRTLSGNLIISATYFNPSANTILLGNSTQRWVLSANTGDFSGNVNATTLSTGSISVSSNGSVLTNTSLTLGNSSVNSTVNATTFTGSSWSANNSEYLQGFNWASPRIIGTTTANGASLTYANVSGQVNTVTLYATTSANVGANVQLTTSQLFVGNATVNSTHTSALVQVSNSTATANLTATSLNIYANSTVNGSFTSTTVSVANSTGNVQTVPTSLTVQNSTVNSVMGLQSLLIQANTTVNSTHTASLLQVANSTGIANLTATSLVIGNTTISTTNTIFGGTIALNGSIGSVGQVLMSNASQNAYWSSIGNGTVTSVASANGVGGGTITGSGTLYVVANNGLVSNTSGVFVLANNGIVANSTGTWAKAANGISVDASGINVNPNTGIISNTTGVFVNQATQFAWTNTQTFSNTITPTSNAVLLGNSTQRWVLSANTGDFSGNVNVTGNVTASLFNGSLSGTYANLTGQVNAASLLLSTNTATIGTGTYFVSNGFVGIGTSTPSDKLQVYGTSSVDFSARVDSAVAGDRPSFRFIHTGGSLTTQSPAASRLGLISFLGVSDASVVSTYAYIDSFLEGTANSTANSYIKFVATNNGTSTEILRVAGNAVLVNSTINAASYTVGTYGATTNGAIVNATSVGVGNSSVNATINTSAFVLNGVVAGGFYKGNSSNTLNPAAAGNIFRVNSNTLTASVTFAAGENGTATGPIAINTGVSLIIQTGARVSIV